MYLFLNVQNHAEISQSEKPEGYAGTGVCAMNVPRGSGMLPVNDAFRFGKNLENRRYRGFYPDGFFEKNEKLSFVN